MAHFYGTLQGSRGEASRLGTEKSGFEASACSWQGRIDVSLWSRDDGDHYRVVMRQHGYSQGWEGEIASGIMGEQPERGSILPTPTVYQDQIERIKAVLADCSNADDALEAIGNIVR